MTKTQRTAIAALHKSWKENKTAMINRLLDVINTLYHTDFKLGEEINSDYFFGLSQNRFTMGFWVEHIMLDVSNNEIRISGHTECDKYCEECYDFDNITDFSVVADEVTIDFATADGKEQDSIELAFCGLPVEENEREFDEIVYHHSLNAPKYTKATTFFRTGTTKKLTQYVLTCTDRQEVEHERTSYHMNLYIGSLRKAISGYADPIISVSYTEDCGTYTPDGNNSGDIVTFFGIPDEFYDSFLVQHAPHSVDGEVIFAVDEDGVVYDSTHKPITITALNGKVLYKSNKNGNF